MSWQFNAVTPKKKNYIQILLLCGILSKYRFTNNKMNGKKHLLLKATAGTWWSEALLVFSAE